MELQWSCAFIHFLFSAIDAAETRHAEFVFQQHRNENSTTSYSRTELWLWTRKKTDTDHVYDSGAVVYPPDSPASYPLL